MSWGTELWVSRGEGRPATRWLLREARAGRARRTVGGPAALGCRCPGRWPRAGGSCSVFVCSPPLFLPRRGSGEGGRPAARAPAAAVGLSAGRPAGSGVCRHPPPSLSGRLAPSRAALLSLCIPPPAGGGGDPHCPEGVLFASGEGACRDLRRSQGPGAGGRRRTPAARGSREAPPRPQVRGAGRLCSESGLWASEAQTYTPIPLSLPACCRRAQLTGARVGGPVT